MKVLYISLFLILLGPLNHCYGTELDDLINDLTKDHGTQEKAAKTLAKLFRPNSPKIIELIESKDSALREGGFEVLRWIGKPAVPVLVPYLKDKRVMYRRQAAYYLGKIGKEASGAVKSLAKTLRDEHCWVRLDAANALTKMGRQSRPAIPALLRCLGDKVSDVRRACSDAIFPFVKELLPSLLTKLKDPSWAVRAGAAEALGSPHLPPEIVLPALFQLLNDEDETVACAASCSINMFENVAVPYLVKGLRSRSLRERVSAARLLSYLDRCPRTVLPAVIVARIPPEVREEVVDEIRWKQKSVPWWVLPAVYHNEIKTFLLLSNSWLLILGFCQWTFKKVRSSSFAFRFAVLSLPLSLLAGAGVWMASNEPWARYFIPYYSTFGIYLWPVVSVMTILIMGLGITTCLDLLTSSPLSNDQAEF